MLLLILVMLPFWTSYLIRTYAWMIILRDNGVANSILSSHRADDDPIPFLNTDFAVVLGMTYGFLPFAILPLYVSIDRLDDNLVQAARDLYASGRAAFLHVILPLTMPGIIAAAVLTFIPAMGDYVTPDLLGGAQTTTIAKIVQVLFTSGRDWPYGSALGFMLMVITLAGTLFALRALRQETFGVRTGRNPLADGVRRPHLRVPVRPDRGPDRLQLQRLAPELRVARLHDRLVPEAVRQPGPARRAVGHDRRSRSSRSSCRRSSGTLLGLAWPANGSAARAPPRS